MAPNTKTPATRRKPVASKTTSPEFDDEYHPSGSEEEEAVGNDSAIAMRPKRANANALNEADRGAKRVNTQKESPLKGMVSTDTSKTNTKEAASTSKAAAPVQKGSMQASTGGNTGARIYAFETLRSPPASPNANQGGSFSIGGTEDDVANFDFEALYKSLRTELSATRASNTELLRSFDACDDARKSLLKDVTNIKGRMDMAEKKLVELAKEKSQLEAKLEDSNKKLQEQKQITLELRKQTEMKQKAQKVSYEEAQDTLKNLQSLTQKFNKYVDGLKPAGASEQST